MGKITIYLNGNQTSIDNLSSIQSLIQLKKLSHNLIIVEHNGTILSKEEFKKTIIKENDSIEIIRYIGGGKK